MEPNSVDVAREVYAYGPVIVDVLKTGFFIGLSAFLAYKYGLVSYFKQREHEQIIKRYLEEGIDRAEASIEHAVGVFTDNNRIALSIVRALIQKEAGLAIEEKDYSLAFRKYEQQYFDSIPFVKIHRLVGDTIFWKSAQLLYAFVDGKSIWFENDFRMAVKNIVEGTVDVPIKTLLEATRERLHEDFENSKKYLHILLELDSIAHIIEIESKLTMSELSEFKNRSDVKNSIQKLNDIFAEDLKPFEQKPKQGDKDEQKQ